jgi:hypothetical protein
MRTDKFHGFIFPIANGCAGRTLAAPSSLQQGVIDAGHCPVACSHRAEERARLIHRVSKLTTELGHV